MEYITIDFETANGNLTSACSVGLVGVNNGKIVFEKYYLINPQEPFSLQNTFIHGLTEKDVKNAPTFKQLWPEIKELIDKNKVFAHAATFDIGVLKSLLDKYHLPYPDIKIGCTLRLSKIAFRGEIPNCKLGTISSYLEVDHLHHNAISDAKICFYLIERAKRIYQVYDVDDLFEMVNLNFGVLNEKTYSRCSQKVAKKNTKKVVAKRFEGQIFAYTGKPRTMTKTEVKKVIEENGGLISKNIGLVINTFIVFTNPTKSHLNALEIVKAKKDVKILYEEEFLRIINDK